MRFFLAFIVLAIAAILSFASYASVILSDAPIFIVFIPLVLGVIIAFLVLLINKKK